VRRIRIRFGVNGHCLNPHQPASPDDPDGNLSPVCYQHLLKHVRTPPPFSIYVCLANLQTLSLFAFKENSLPIGKNVPLFKGWTKSASSSNSGHLLYYSKPFFKWFPEFFRFPCIYRTSLLSKKSKKAGVPAFHFRFYLIAWNSMQRIIFL
jgi:hypothetical protein